MIEEEKTSLPLKENNKIEMKIQKTHSELNICLFP